MPAPAIPTAPADNLRVRLDISYDGSRFNGWGIQPGLPTVQGSLEQALELIFRRSVRLTVAGRTDAGVHARGQVAHLDVTRAEWDGVRRGHDVVPAESLVRRLGGALGRLLGDDHGAIAVTAACEAPDGFDARFSALWRRYSYRIADAAVPRDPLTRSMTLWHKHRLDVGLMNQAARPLLGLQDFRAYCKPRDGSTTVRELQQFRFDTLEDGVIVATVQADAFCHNMVRALTGAALRVGQGLEEPGWMHERLLVGERDAKSVLASPHALVLEEVHYPPAVQLLARAELTRARRDTGHHRPL
ncbi:tRNA pseudouridine synthase A [Specibacter cremeus]|uniref:tRNA pseudouridine synthase A n=1 Tax=Specibacter cremeus TaxID=1629051 RepID=UPI000F7AD57C|nr:tRNA pseudouridine synthase A [Specibacter cremeus]